MARPVWSALFLLAFAPLIYAYWPTLVTLHLRWMEFSHSYSHGYLLLVVAGYLIWQDRQQLSGRWQMSAWLALPLLLGAALFWFAGFATQLTLAQQLALPAIAWLCLVVALGWRAGWWLILPALMIYLGIPVWDFLVEPLQRLTVAVTQTLLFWFSIPAYVHGFYIEVPTGAFEVAGGCSGLNYLLVGTVVGVLHAYLNVTGWPRRTAAVVLVLGLALLSNWIRVFSLVLIGYYTHMQSEMIEDHDGFGWFVFAGALVVFFLLSRWLLEKPGIRPAAVDTGRPMNWRLAAGRIWIACLIAATLPLWARWFDARLSQGNHVGLPTPPVAGARNIEPEWMPDYQGFDVQQAWQARVAGEDVEIVALTWHTQEQDRKLIYYSNRLADEGQLAATLPPVDAGSLTMNRAVVRKGIGERLVWWFYLVGDNTATGRLETKLKQFPAYLAGNPRAAIVTLSLRCGSSECGEERKNPRLEDAMGQLAIEALAAWR